MAWYNKIIWSEGMFLQPHHFQQHDRYLEAMIEGRCSSLHTYSWGLKELTIDAQLLGQGKLTLASAQGVMPDGTPFDISEDCDEAPITDIPENTRDCLVYLTLPTRRRNGAEISTGDERQDNVSRYLARDDEVCDYMNGSDNFTQLQTGRLRLRLMLASEDRNDFVCLPIAKIIEINSDKNITLDEHFIPPYLDSNASPRLSGFLDELQGLLHHRGEALASRITESGQGGAAEIADYMMLQTVNRLEPLFLHLNAIHGLHPEDFYRMGVQVAGELTTFATETRRPPVLPIYKHDDLQSCFDPLMQSLRGSLSMVIQQNAVPIPLKAHKYGIWAGTVPDPKLLESAEFVLAVNAQLPNEQIRSRFPTQVKIGSVEKISQLVNLQLPGIGMRPLPVAPRQIPYHSGFTYFELDRKSELWESLKRSGGFAFHISGDFPGINMEFWAIKG